VDEAAEAEGIRKDTECGSVARMKVVEAGGRFGLP
jgi:hypothetical protein